MFADAQASAVSEPLTAEGNKTAEGDISFDIGFKSPNDNTGLVMEEGIKLSKEKEKEKEKADKKEKKQKKEERKKAQFERRLSQLKRQPTIGECD